MGPEPEQDDDDIIDELSELFDDMDDLIKEVEKQPDRLETVDLPAAEQPRKPEKTGDETWQSLLKKTQSIESTGPILPRKTEPVQPEDEEDSVLLEAPRRPAQPVIRSYKDSGLPKKKREAKKRIGQLGEVPVLKSRQLESKLRPTPPRKGGPPPLPPSVERSLDLPPKSPVSQDSATISEGNSLEPVLEAPRLEGARAPVTTELDQPEAAPITTEIEAPEAAPATTEIEAPEAAPATTEIVEPAATSSVEIEPADDKILAPPSEPVRPKRATSLEDLEVPTGPVLEPPAKAAEKPAKGTSLEVEASATSEGVLEPPAVKPAPSPPMPAKPPVRPEPLKASPPKAPTPVGEPSKPEPVKAPPPQAPKPVSEPSKPEPVKASPPQAPTPVVEPSKPEPVKASPPPAIPEPVAEPAVAQVTEASEASPFKKLLAPVLLVLVIAGVAGAFWKGPGETPASPVTPTPTPLATASLPPVPDIPAEAFKSPESAIKKFLEYAAAGDLARAQGLLTDQTRAGMTNEQLKSLIAGWPLERLTVLEVFMDRVGGDSAVVDLAPAGADTATHTFMCQRIGGRWKIQKLRL